MDVQQFFGVKYASKHGVGGFIIGNTRACRPTVFRAEWPLDIKADLASALECTKVSTVATTRLQFMGRFVDIVQQAHHALLSKTVPDTLDPLLALHAQLQNWDSFVCTAVVPNWARGLRRRRSLHQKNLHMYHGGSCKLQSHPLE